jgi:hypothetical protein
LATDPLGSPSSIQISLAQAHTFSASDSIGIYGTSNPMVDGY